MPTGNQNPPSRVPQVGAFERRLVSGVPVTIRTSDAGRRIIGGHAAVFNQIIDLGWFREKIAPGAFNSALNRPDDVRALFNHDPNKILGRTKSGTLALSLDATGLLYDVTPVDTQVARDLIAWLDAGDIDQSSFAFRVKEQTLTYMDDGEVLRTIEDVELLDVSPVTYPAYTGTDSYARAGFQPYGDEIREQIEAFRAASPKAPVTTKEGRAAATRRNRLRLLELEGGIR